MDIEIKKEALEKACCYSLKACIEMNAVRYDRYTHSPYHLFAHIGDGSSEYMGLGFCPFCGSKLK